MVWSSATGVFHSVKGSAKKPFRSYLYFKCRPKSKRQEHVGSYDTALEAALAFDRCSVEAQPLSSPAFDPG